MIAIIEISVYLVDIFIIIPYLIANETLMHYEIKDAVVMAVM